MRINRISFRFADVGCLTKQIDVQRIFDIGVQTFVKKESEDVVAEMTSSLKLCICFAQIRCYRLEPLEKQVEAGLVIRNDENTRQDSPIRVYDVAVVPVFGAINSKVYHGHSPFGLIDAAGSTVPLALVTLFHINRERYLTD